MVEGTPEPEEIQVASRPDYKWYILQTYSGYENRVRRTLEEKLRIEHLEELVEEIFVPGDPRARVRPPSQASSRLSPISPRASQI